MELKNITELETQYPTDKQIDKKKLKKNIPIRWTKLGLTAFIFNLMMSGKAFAESSFINDMHVMGEMPVEIEVIPRTVQFVRTTLHILPIIMGILTVIETIRLIIKKKKGEEADKLKKRAIIFAVTTVVLILVDIFFVGIGKELLIELL